MIFLGDWSHDKRGMNMKIIEANVPVKARIRVPNTWGMRRVARELTDKPLVDRETRSGFRPSQVLSVEVSEADITDLVLIAAQDAVQATL